MISFLRDLYVQIPGGYSDNRLNAAYVFGGFPLLMDTLHTNFGVSIDGCFEVDFSGFQSVIDILGGVDIEMTSKEARTINIGTELVFTTWMEQRLLLILVSERLTMTFTGPSVSAMCCRQSIPSSARAMRQT